MAENVDNLVLEQLRAMRSEMSKMADWMHTMSAELTAIRQHLSGVVTLREHDHAYIASIKHRLDHIERRLEPVDER